VAIKMDVTNMFPRFLLHVKSLPTFPGCFSFCGETSLKKDR
jgi:hypothetical protein